MIRVDAADVGSPVSALLRDELLALYRDRLGHEPPHDVLEPPDRLWAWLLAYDGDEPVGCGMLVPPGEVRRMYVRPAARGRGAGRALLAALEERARDRGCARLGLLTTEVLVEARALYGAAGYRVRGVRATGDGRRLDLWLERGLR